MSDREDAPGADLPKKERLMNAWIAVGPKGKTTDVSDLTGSSRGYASDIRRAMAGEDEEDDLPFEDIADAYDPSLVATYRSKLAEDAIDGRWPFEDRLEVESIGDPSGPTTGEPVPRSRAGPATVTHADPQGTGAHPPETGNPGGRTPQPPRQPRPADPPAQSPQPAYPAAQGAAGQAVPSQPAQQAQPTSAPGGFRDRLADLDRQLVAQQQRATAELNSLPQGSQAHAIALSKYNLLVDIRESLRQLATVARPV